MKQNVKSTENRRRRSQRNHLRRKITQSQTATAYHEAGHVVAAIAFDYLAESDLVTIEAKDGALGSVSRLPPLMQGCENKGQVRELVEQICIGLYSGLAAQRLFDPLAPGFQR